MDLWQTCNQIRVKGQWTNEDIETLIFYIQHLIELNDQVATELGEALDSLDRLHTRIEFYRQATALKLIEKEAPKIKPAQSS